MLRRTLIALTLVSLFCLSACQSNGDNTGAFVYPHPGVDGLPPISSDPAASSSLHLYGYFAYTTPIVPITFTVTTDGSLSVDVGAEFETSLGTFSVGGGVVRSVPTGKQLPVGTVGVTRLLICLKGSDRQDCQAYTIRTGRRIKIALNGKFQETIENGLVIIDASPGSKVVVSDAGPPNLTGPRPAARIDVEDYAFTVAGPYTDVDLERSLGGKTDDLGYDHVTGRLILLNGAKVADIQHYASHAAWPLTGLPKMNLPDEDDCARTKQSAWQSRFTAANLRADITLACIFTADGDFGYMVIGRNVGDNPVSYYLYSYVWVR